MSTLRGADVIARTLARAGATHLFSLSGNHVMAIYDAALDAASRSFTRDTKARRYTWPTHGDA